MLLRKQLSRRNESKPGVVKFEYSTRSASQWSDSAARSRARRSCHPRSTSSLRSTQPTQTAGARWMSASECMGVEGPCAPPAARARARGCGAATSRSGSARRGACERPQMSRRHRPWSSGGLLTHLLCAATHAPRSRVHREPPMYLIEDFLAPEVRISSLSRTRCRPHHPLSLPHSHCELLRARPSDQSHQHGRDTC